MARSKKNVWNTPLKEGNHLWTVKAGVITVVLGVIVFLLRVAENQTK